MSTPGEEDPRSRVVELGDERTPMAQQALELIAESFDPHERHSLSALRTELTEKRLGLLVPYDYHLLVMLGEQGEVVATIAGVYLAGLNAGFITYLAVRPELRGKRLGRQIRGGLVEIFREDARRNGREELAWVLGEVRTDSPWLRALVRGGQAIPFDLTYYHPGMEPGESPDRYVLYRQPVGDPRPELPAAEVRQIVYSIWRRAYRVGYPVYREAFRAMLAELEGEETVGVHPEFAELMQH